MYIVYWLILLRWGSLLWDISTKETMILSSYTQHFPSMKWSCHFWKFYIFVTLPLTGQIARDNNKVFFNHLRKLCGIVLQVQRSLRVSVWFYSMICQLSVSDFYKIIIILKSNIDMAMRLGITIVKVLETHWLGIWGSRTRLLSILTHSS